MINSVFIQFVRIQYGLPSLPPFINSKVKYKPLALTSRLTVAKEREQNLIYFMKSTFHSDTVKIP